MRRLVHIVLLLVGFVAAFGAGAWLSMERRAVGSTAGVDQRLTASLPAVVKRGFPSDEEMLSVIMSAVSEDEPLLRAHRLHDALGRLSSAELGVLFGKALQMEDRARRSALLSVLLARWAIVDPTATDAAVRPYLDRSRRKLRTDPRSADTTVCLEHRIFGKPSDLADAERMLEQLQGRTHEVVTAICLVHLREHRQKVFAESTSVTFRPLNGDIIRQYLSLIDPLDKAGAYAIQEKAEMIVEEYSGSFSNVVGLPLERLQVELEAW